ncbi:hypothetical protein [Moraxella catarrhalis]|uniref:hypothetical protein n=1 Tax=Moraxella catarrhalis TaxID=480 RepID=UPI001D0DA882|nr:hypothetical protein [Moraxella catarrhalis]
MALAINIVLGANTVHFSRNIQKATQNAKKYYKALPYLPTCKRRIKTNRCRIFSSLTQTP